MAKKPKFTYLITSSRAHFLPTQMLVNNLCRSIDSPIVVVGNLNSEEAELITLAGADYIDEDDIDYRGRLPKVSWNKKHREFGWYKQQFIRLCIDRFIQSKYVVILDSETFLLDNWDEDRLFDNKTGLPRCGYWIPKDRKPDWDYMMYRGAAYLLSFLPGCEDIMEYANSDKLKRSITGMAVFSTANVAQLWKTLEERTDLSKNLKSLLDDKSMTFSEYVLYSLAAEYGLFNNSQPTVLVEGLLGWYDNHTDPEFAKYKKGAMWSMCQQYQGYNTATEYYRYMTKTAKSLRRKLPKDLPYWNEPDRELINHKYDKRKDIGYFKRYRKQLDHTFRKRFKTMFKALTLLSLTGKPEPTIVEVGTLRDANKGGGHSTYKFGEYCERFGGHLHTVDILPEAIKFSKKASKDFQPWISYHVSDSTKFLKQFKGTIDLLYLDGYDSTDGKETEASEKQLTEIKAALPKLADDCIVLLDDADLPKKGKVAYSSQFLLDNGFKLKINAYQQLYVRGNFNRNKVGSLRKLLRKK